MNSDDCNWDLLDDKNVLVMKNRELKGEKMNEIPNIVNVDSQKVLSNWYERAFEDDSVRPYLSAGLGFSEFQLTDGIYLTDCGTNYGMLYILPEEHKQSCDIGFWVIRNDVYRPRSILAAHLIKKALEIVKENENFKFITAFCSSTNEPSKNFLTDIMGFPWGREKLSFFDTSLDSPQWVDRLEFRKDIDAVQRLVERFLREGS